MHCKWRAKEGPDFVKPVSGVGMIGSQNRWTSYISRAENGVTIFVVTSGVSVSPTVFYVESKDGDEEDWSVPSLTWGKEDVGKFTTMSSLESSYVVITWGFSGGEATMFLV